MNKVSVQKLSLLGIVLMAVSAFTTLVYPKKVTAQLQIRGSLTQSKAWEYFYTCTPTIAVNDICDLDEGTITTVYPEIDSYQEGVQTDDNTTLDY